MKIIRFITTLFICLTGIYILLALLIPPDSSVLTKYGISAAQAKILSLTVSLPLVAIWATALISLRRITRYALKIRQDSDGEAFMYIARGLAVLVIGLPVNAIISTSSKYIARLYPDFSPTSVILNNYLSLIILLVGFFIISKGTKLLLERTSKSSIALPAVWRIMIILLSIGFVYATLSNPARLQPLTTNGEAAYYLPDWIIVATIIVPYIYAWYIGISAAQQLSSYSKKVTGVIYKHALKFISVGLMFVIGASILLRFLSRLNTFFQETELRILLIVIYLLLLFISLGYIFIAVGAKKLKTIEDV